LPDELLSELLLVLLDFEATLLLLSLLPLSAK
jgi:hypothetical protein